MLTEIGLGTAVRLHWITNGTEPDHCRGGANPQEGRLGAYRLIVRIFGHQRPYFPTSGSDVGVGGGEEM